MPAWARTIRHVGVRSIAALTVATVLAASVSVVVPAEALGPRPPNPSDQQINTARAKKDAAAKAAGVISARIVTIQAQLDQLNSDAQVAEQKLALALQRKQAAATAASLAADKVSAAQDDVARAQEEFVRYAQAAYMSGSIGGTTGVLLTASDPSSLMQQDALQQYVSDHQIDAIGQLQRATVVESNSEAAARLALARKTSAADVAVDAQQNVLSALSAAQGRKATLEAQLVQDRKQLQAAQIALTGIVDKRAAYLVWKKQQELIAAREAARKRRIRLQQQRAAGAESGRQNGQHPSGGGGSGSGNRQGGGASAPSGGSWTPARGRQAVSRAMRYLGMRYSWAAGNANGPTYGVSEPGAAWNDSNILGFDCSGLTLYAWSPYLGMDHYAATQFTQAGSYHPSIDNLMPGDLVFWSGDGSIGGIGHEAMYIGNGNVIQAPQSGDVIKITNIFGVENGYFGATRPLT